MVPLSWTTRWRVATPRRRDVGRRQTRRFDDGQAPLRGSETNHVCELLDCCFLECPDCRVLWVAASNAVGSSNRELQLPEAPSSGGPAITQEGRPGDGRRRVLIVGSRFPEQRQSAAEEMLGLVEVVRAAAQFQIGDARRTADAVWLDMMKFQKAAFRAATLRADERALAAVSRPHRSSDCRRNVARPPDS